MQTNDGNDILEWEKIWNLEEDDTSKVSLPYLLSLIYN